MPALIEMDLVKTGTVIVGNFDQHVSGLHQRNKWPAPQHARRQATDLRTVLAIVGLPFRGDFLSRDEPLRLAWFNGHW